MAASVFDVKRKIGLEIMTRIRDLEAVCIFALDVTIVCGRSMNGMAIRVLGAARCGIANINGSELTVR